MASLVRQQEKKIDELSAQLSASVRITEGIFIWKISGFKAKLAEGRSLSNNGEPGLELKSDAFYTSLYGYKLAASLFPNGNGSGEGTHMSIYIRVLPGEYDNLLEWPVRVPISFRLIDQCSDPEKQLHITESFAPKPSWKQFQKPSSSDDSEMMGFGYPRFLSHEMLKGGTYIRDDTIFIRIKVDTGKLILP